MNLNNFTIKAQEAVQHAQQIAMQEQHQAIEPAHLLKGILQVDENVTPFVLKKLGVNFDNIKKATDSIIQSYPSVSGGSQYLSRTATEVLQKANTYLRDFGDEFVALEHILLALLSRGLFEAGFPHTAVWSEYARWIVELHFGQLLSQC